MLDYKNETKQLIDQLAKEQPIIWINEELLPFAEAESYLSFGKEDIHDAEDRLLRFAPFIMRSFPETKSQGGIIESPLVEIKQCKEEISRFTKIPEGRLFLKMDSHLAIAGSIKARGGIYEVLKHAETLANEHGIISKTNDYSDLIHQKDFFNQYKIQVGSTGNLGMSIGIMSAKLGFQVVVHMSSDAKEWKKELLRSHGVQVIEYASDYGKAVEEGRKLSDEDPSSYFVDDEHSQDLYLGYSVAAKRLQQQLVEQGIIVDKTHPLFVYLPCGVGGAPGGITFGLKVVWGDAVHCIFTEPTGAPCMTLGLVTGKHDQISVQDIGLSGKTQADGLAVGRPSGLVSKEMRHLISGCVTVQDESLFQNMRILHRTEDIFIEPSSCAAFAGYQAMVSNEFLEYLKKTSVSEYMNQSIHILWATGGSMVPDDVKLEYLHKHYC